MVKEAEAMTKQYRKPINKKMWGSAASNLHAVRQATYKTGAS